MNSQGLPLGLVISGANTPDGQLLEATLTAVPLDRPDPQATEQHLCLDKAYSGEPCATVAAAEGYTIHVPDKANAKKTQASAGTAQTPPLDRRSRAFMDQSLSPFAHPLGEESLQLSQPAVFRLRHHLLAQV